MKARDKREIEQHEQTRVKKTLPRIKVSTRPKVEVRNTCRSPSNCH